MQLCELKTKIVDKDYASRFISRYHYSHNCSNIVLAIGQWYGDELVNCIVFNYCCGREMAKQVLKNGSNDNVLELSRMVSIEPKPKNLESYAISRALKLLKDVMPNIEVVVSYADNTMGHKGYCYQASGFTYYGQSRPTKEFYLDGKRIHERNLNNNYGTSSIEELKKKLGDRIVVKTNKETKSRYYIILAKDKREKKLIKKNILVKSLPFPKGDNKRYDMDVYGEFASQDRKDEKVNIDLSRQLTFF
jgi:hypothetical protein